jgi:hypothetical protein
MAGSLTACIRRSPAQAAAHAAAWEVDVVEKQRLVKMLPDRESFAASIMSRREEEFKALKTSRDKVRRRGWLGWASGAWCSCWHG